MRQSFILMNENMASLLAGFGLCYSGGIILSTHLKSITTARFRNLVNRSAKNPWLAGTWGMLFNIVVGRASILAMIISGLLSAGMMTVAQALPMVVWGNVGGVVIVYLAVINLKVLALFLIGIAGIAYGFGNRSRLRNLLGSLLGISMLIFGVVLVKQSAQGAYDAAWLEGLFSLIDGRLWAAFLLGCALKVITQSGLVLALLEISLAEAGIINLAEVVAIFLGSRVATSVSSWLFSLSYQGPGKQLMMIQVFYNLIGSTVLLAVLYLETWTHLPLVQALLTTISDNISIQVASLALVYCLATSLLITLIREPFLRYIEGRWPYREDTDPFAPRFISDQALNSPETALDLVDLEQTDLVKRLQRYIELMREPPTDKAAQSALNHSHEAFRSVAKKINVFLVDLGNQNLSTDTFDRFLTTQNRQGILISLENQVFAFADSRTQIGGHERLGQVIERLMESLDFILLTAIDAFATRDPHDIRTLSIMTGDKGSTMKKMRDVYLGQDGRFDGREQDALLDSTRLFERTVWLLHLLIASLEESPDDAPALTERG